MEISPSSLLPWGLWAVDSKEAIVSAAPPRPAPAALVFGSAMRGRPKRGAVVLFTNSGRAPRDWLRGDEMEMHFQSPDVGLVVLDQLLKHAFGFGLFYVG